MNTVTLPASAVHDVLKAAVPFAGKDTTLPMLCAVQLDTIDGYLVATATNRYVVGRSRAKLTEGEWAGPFLMTLADAKRQHRRSQGRRCGDVAVHLVGR